MRNLRKFENLGDFDLFQQICWNSRKFSSKLVRFGQKLRKMSEHSKMRLWKCENVWRNLADFFNAERCKSKCCRSRHELSNHCSRHHPVNVTGDVGEQSKDDDGNGDDGNTVSKRKKPNAGYGQNEPKAAASKRCRKDSSGDKGTTCKKVKPL